ncbi:uncharacterized protein F5891DRAFT_1124725 [Suillus fuscotomentosus]|uniref:Guanine nucleotide exchange factor Vps9 n=1 Tax=Suillus fuscotomentosus TaxID=1912939 RepID=A0AAD4HRZ9_9AGAM|nr:uncharacterized protein F5891DRAFT_1124725 [Suillus fuscotomentosus]KAG1907935.1 hypothetical protein F5891DRAFT_1124725 [Suillus fuscotomentosus]
MLDAQENSTLTSDFDSLHISLDSRPPPGLQTPAIPSITEAQNPWSEEQLKLDLKPAHTPDPTAINAASPSVFAAPADLINNALDHQVRVSKDVLTQFDPFTNEDELSAHQAWASSEGHPPPPRIPSRPSSRAHSRSASKDIQRDGPSSRSGSPSPQPSTSSASSAFPSLAAIARTFSIPSVATRARPRPLSMDAAKPIATPSPTTVSSFAQQQSQSTAPSPLSKQIPLPSDYAASKTQSAPDTRSATPAITSPSGSESPRKDKDPSFNFQKFLDQMKSRGAEPLGKYVRSFLSNFTKRTFTVNDQIKIINDFLGFIATKMRETDIWRNATEEEFDNAMEGMEKLVMNRLYEYTYTPCLPLLTPPRPVTADDLERDRVLSQRIALFSWVRPRHLDIPELESDDNDGNTGFLEFAQQELCKVNHYKAPRDKLICILNCCKIIFGLIRHLRKDEGADSFVPILIYVVLRANPEHLLSNVEFINRFRNPAKLQSEAGYYLSSLMGAAEFERNVEAAIQTLPPSLPSSPTIAQGSQTPNQLPRQSPHAGEESAQPLALAVPSSAQNLTIGEDARKLLQKTGDVVSKPLGAISRIFSEALDEKMGYLPGPFAPFELGREERERHWSHPDQVAQFAGGTPHTPTGSEGLQAPMQTPYKPRVRRTSPVPTPPTHMGYSYGADETPSRPGSRGPYVHQALALGPAQPLPPPNAIPQHLQPPSVGQHISRTPTPSLDLTAVEAEIDRAHAQASAAARATLAQIFPGVDPEVRDWVLEANGGDLGKSIEGLLDMAGGS